MRRRISDMFIFGLSHSCFFFFSSRRRHTRFDCDWSSDVCSSDLRGGTLPRYPPRADSCPSAFGDRTAESRGAGPRGGRASRQYGSSEIGFNGRSEEHTSELQSQSNIVCRLLLEKKKKSNPRYVPS